jgi:lipoate-protein ligase A
MSIRSVSVGNRVVANEARFDGTTNMSRDLAMLAKVERGGGPIARIYEWKGAWVSLGRSQVPEVVLIKGSGIPWVVRPTGGGAVLHGHDLTVSVAMSLNRDARRLKEIYRSVATPIVYAMNDIGLDATLGEEMPERVSSVKSPDCFASISVNDIVDRQSGKKIVGIALRVTKAGVLAQCSIPVDKPLVDVASLFEVPHLPPETRISKQCLREALTQRLVALAGQ